METKEIKQILQRYFNGESSLEDEKILEAYFQSGDVADEVVEYAEFFGGISELTGAVDDSQIEEDVMDFILENEHKEKTKYLGMWKMVTGIAASIIIVLGGFLFYQQQQKPFDDTYENPEQAYAYAQQTLQFVSGKYSKGFAEFSNFEKLQKANKSLKKGITPVNEFYEGIEKMKEESRK
ncbi:MAG: hypothetical protein HQ522_19195 [Bacteroidetes bacterium]|nr:hypothetical protein [Bacteroidota bacterium]